MNQSNWVENLTSSTAPPETRRETLESMRAALHGDDSKLRDQALNTITQVGMSASELREELVGLWRERNARLELHSLPSLIYALGRIRQVDTLIEVLRQEDIYLRRTAANALAPIGRAAVAAAPALVESLRDNDKRYTAMRALRNMGQAAVPDLMAGLSDTSSLLRSRVLQVLGFIGPSACEAVPAVVRALDDPDPIARKYAIEVLGRLIVEFHQEARRQPIGVAFFQQQQWVRGLPVLRSSEA